MDRIETPIRTSKTFECRGCGAAWRIYEDDAEVVPDPDCWYNTRFWITCEACGHRLDITFVLDSRMKHRLELKTIREKREKEKQER